MCWVEQSPSRLCDDIVLKPNEHIVRDPNSSKYSASDEQAGVPKNRDLRK